MEKEKLSFEVVCQIGDYGIIKCKEKQFYNDRSKTCITETWYDVCLDGGNGDIVASFRGLIEARKWAKEN